MALDDDVALFMRVPMLALLGDAALRILAIGAESRRLSSGQVLFYAGDLADAGYLIQEGAFMLEPDRPENGEAVTVGPATLLGEVAMLTDTVRQMTATAMEPATVIRIPRSLFVKMLEGYPGAAKKLRDAFTLRAQQWTRELDGVKTVLDRDYSKT